MNIKAEIAALQAAKAMAEAESMAKAEAKSRQDALASSSTGPSGGSSGCLIKLHVPYNLSGSDADDEEPQVWNTMMRSILQMRTFPSRPFDPKKYRNFKIVKKYDIQFEVSKCLDKNHTGSLFLLLDVECFEVSKHLGKKSTNDFDKS
jgi:hypothetical protein